MLVAKEMCTFFPLFVRKCQNAETQDLFFKILRLSRVNMRAGVTAFSALLSSRGHFKPSGTVNERILMTEQTKMLIMLEVFEKAMVKVQFFILTFRDRLE
jgi:hypothetical protein